MDGGHLDTLRQNGDMGTSGKIWRPYGFTRLRLAWGGHGNKTTCRQWTAAEAEAATSTGDNIPRHKRTTVTCSSDHRPLKGHVIGTLPPGCANWNDRITFASANCILSCPGRSGTWGSGLASACPNTASWSLQYPSLHPMKGVQMHFAPLCTKKIMEKLYKALVQLSLIRNRALGFLTFEEFTALKRAFGSTGVLIDSDRSLNHLHPTWIIR